MIRDVAWSLSAMVARLGTNLALFFFLARAWAPATFGAFAVRLAFAAVATRAIEYGFGALMTREIGAAPSKARPMLGQVLWARGVLCALLMAAGGGAALVGVWIGVDASRIGQALTRVLAGPSPGSGEPSVDWTVILAILMLDAAVLGFATAYEAVLRSLGAFDTHARISLLTHTMVALAAIVGLALHGGPLVVALAILFGHVLHLLLVRVAAQRCIATNAPGSDAGRGVAAMGWPGWREVGGLLRAGLPFGAHVAIAALAFHVDGLVTAAVLTAATVGVYQAGLRLNIGALGISDALAPVYVTALARVVNVGTPEARAEVRRLASRFTRQMAAFGALCVGGLTATAPWLPTILFGAGYETLTPVLPWFGAVLAMRVVAGSAGAILSLSHRQSLRAAASGIALVVTGAFTAWGGTRFGMLGALWGALIGTGVSLLVFVVSTYRDWGTTHIDGRTLVLCGATAALLVLTAMTDGITTQLGGAMLCVVSLIAVATPAEWGELADRVRRRLRSGRMSPVALSRMAE